MNQLFGNNSNQEYQEIPLDDHTEKFINNNMVYNQKCTDSKYFVIIDDDNGFQYNKKINGLTTTYSYNPNVPISNQYHFKPNEAWKTLYLIEVKWYFNSQLSKTNPITDVSKHVMIQEKNYECKHSRLTVSTYTLNDNGYTWEYNDRFNSDRFNNDEHNLYAYQYIMPPKIYYNEIFILDSCRDKFQDVLIFTQ
jgi:hypothetical protein